MYASPASARSACITLMRCHSVHAGAVPAAGAQACSVHEQHAVHHEELAPVCYTGSCMSAAAHV